MLHYTLFELYSRCAGANKHDGRDGTMSFPHLKYSTISSRALLEVLGVVWPTGLF